MSRWRALAIELFPEHVRGWALDFDDPKTSLYHIFFDLEDELDGHIETVDFEWLGRVFKLIEWCFRQRNHSPDIWNAAAVSLLEHMADKDERAVLIPRLVKPPLFEAMWSEFKKRRERSGQGKAKILLDNYNRAWGTTFDYSSKSS